VTSRIPPPPTAPPLLDATSVPELGRQLDLARDLVLESIAGAGVPASSATPAVLRGAVEAVDLDRPVTVEGALDEVRRLYLDHAVWFHHPRYQAHLNCPVAISAVAADLIASAVNTSVDTWDQSGGATLIEHRLVEWTAQRAGLGSDADGIFTSGGTQSNLQALVLARGEARIRGVAPERMRVLASTNAHFSTTRAAALLGLPAGAVVRVPVDAAGRMLVAELEEALVDVAVEGAHAMAVVATAGTTDHGAIDPLAEVAEVCARYDAWLHVDAAYGGGLLVSRTRRHLLDGIERADSVTVDYHKTWFQPVASSALLVRRAATLRHGTHHADYLNPRDDGPDAVPNQVDKSLQTTRRFDALKLWMTLRTLGPDHIGDLLDAVIELAAEVREELAGDPELAVVPATDLSTVLFRWRRPGLGEDELDRANDQARELLLATGAASVARTTLDGRVWLKLTLLNPATTLQDVRDVLDLVRGHARHAADELGAPRAEAVLR
jgi:L-2,4-diaminobutyrate decarboxylase